MYTIVVIQHNPFTIRIDHRPGIRAAMSITNYDDSWAIYKGTTLVRTNDPDLFTNKSFSLV